jgi:hypothetical protein
METPAAIWGVLDAAMLVAGAWWTNGICGSLRSQRNLGIREDIGMIMIGREVTSDI